MPMTELRLRRWRAPCHPGSSWTSSRRKSRRSEHPLTTSIKIGVARHLPILLGVKESVKVFGTQVTEWCLDLVVLDYSEWCVPSLANIRTNE